MVGMDQAIPVTNGTPGLESTKIFMFRVMFDSEKHRDLFLPDDAKLAVKGLAWTPLGCFMTELPSRWERIPG